MGFCELLSPPLLNSIFFYINYMTQSPQEAWKVADLQLLQDL